MGQGPVGKPRSIGKAILLAIVTLGIYTLVWTYMTHSEMKEHTGNGLGGALGLLVFVLLSPVTYFLVPNEIKNMYVGEGKPSPVEVILGLWVLLPIVGSIIWFVKAQRALNEYWMAKGAPAA